LAIHERLVRDNPSVHAYQSALGGTLNNLAEIEMRLGRWHEARQHLERAIARQPAALAGMPRHPTYPRALRGHLLNLAKVNQALDQPAEALRLLEELLTLPRGNATDLYTVACALALSVPLTRGEQGQQALAAEAVQTLNAAIAAGWNDAGKTSRDPDLAPLRDRDDFRRLLAKLFDDGFPRYPFAP
jgi:tetratricopeptide (TPR) repeat protein